MTCCSFLSAIQTIFFSLPVVADKKSVSMSEFRLDRSATLYAVYPFLRFAAGDARFLPVLMYHSISDEHEGNTRAYYKTSTRPEVFRTQMEWLHRNGYQGLDVESALREFQKGGSAGPKPVGITFDDGYRDFYTDAFPTLAEFGFSASVYLPTAYISCGGEMFKQKKCLSWGEVKELRRHGISFGSHTATHPKLIELSLDEVRKELFDSKRTLESELGERITTFAYPYAFPQADKDFVSHFRGFLQEAGYEISVTTCIGCFRAKGDQLAVPRLPVNSCDDPTLFEAKLKGAYDWLSLPQATFKAIKSWMGTRRVAAKAA